MRWGRAAALAAACALAFPARAGADARADGTRAYRAGRYAEALGAFEAAAKQSPSDPEPLADVALALQKLGRTEDAIAANRKVVELAARPGKAKTAKRAKIRQGAYFNLGKLGVAVRVPDEKACGTIATDGDACKRPVFACRKSRLNAGSGLGVVWDVLRVARDKEGAGFIKTEDGEEEYYDRPPLIFGVSDEAYNGRVLNEAALAEQEGDGVLRYGWEEMGDECARVYGSEWSCSGSEAVRVEAVRCIGDAEAGMRSSTELQTSPATVACYRKACERAEKTPWPAVTAEEKEHRKRIDSCYAGLSEIEDTRCVVVYADACAGFVGVYCTKTVDRNKGKPVPDRHKAYEIKIPPETRTGS
jgi:hypothetical protein